MRKKNYKLHKNRKISPQKEKKQNKYIKTKTFLQKGMEIMKKMVYNKKKM